MTRIRRHIAAGQSAPHCERNSRPAFVAHGRILIILDIDSGDKLIAAKIDGQGPRVYELLVRATCTLWNSYKQFVGNSSSD